MSRISLDKARAAKKEAEACLEAAGQPAAVGITRVDGEYAVKVNVDEWHEADPGMPREIDGVLVQVEVVGAVRKRRPDTARTR